MENNELNKSNKVKVIIITALIFLVAIAGISYAYFSIQIQGNDTASSMRLTTANMVLTYNDVNIASDTNVRPGTTITKTLTVTNTGNVTVYYNIIWRDLYNEITNDELIISATCTSGGCSNVPNTVIPTKTTLSHNIAVKNNISIAPGVTHTYQITVEFIETGSNQNYNQNKEFYGTLNIEEATKLSLQTDTGTTGLSTGDVVRATKAGMDNQDFYVVSTNATNTVLLAKYNLLVGDTYNSSTGVYTPISSSSNGYGLQSSTARGRVDGETNWVGVVPFSGGNYWFGSTQEELEDIYSTSYSAAPSAAPGTIFINPDYTITFSTYSIAYYVEGYINTLGINGSGRLLTYTEEKTLESSNSSIVFNGTSYWLGSAYFLRDRVWVVSSGGGVDYGYFDSGSDYGVRPVIVVSTSDINA